MIQTRKSTHPNHKLMALRLNAGLSVDDLARLSGVSAPTIRSMEAGTHVPQAHTRTAIASVFGLESTDLWPLASRAFGRGALIPA